MASPRRCETPEPERKKAVHNAGAFLTDTSYGMIPIPIELEPEWLSMLGTVVVIEDLRPGTYPRTNSLIRILETRAPATDWHREVLSPHSNRKQILEALKVWRDGIRTLAPDLVAGVPLDDLAWG